MDDTIDYGKTVESSPLSELWNAVLAEPTDPEAHERFVKLAVMMKRGEEAIRLYAECEVPEAQALVDASLATLRDA